MAGVVRQRPSEAEVNQAAMEGDVERLRMLLEHGLPFISQQPHFTPLMAAVVGGSADCVSMLLEREIAVNQIAMFHRTALYYAAHKPENQKILELLLKSGANPNIASRGRTPAQYARQKGFVDNAEFLDSFCGSSFKPAKRSS
mmetsp:Transcript_1937/g.2619  ORF Transcript_1937/g.2619 Transcript_1937/m.2619 type:complete len:143 (-) Transcript_1937:382-810(-)|eukprot:CAMPEP_0201504612 /NCGR_PEP_ID=MMETSP0151_2-20130828/85302_1 /ASSEMBLY_ACC=CAM_ASM_000257 /TAXON_ID=200890 /ORGANISM="Paramoeba atlantica, Strain 621/1 / CCAP 1560/9" /LENGTH=142 /DNA_ID=CAMNT_0047898373 /DNA_START=128 /DNA_END=556 /DNA_ORIENTATION=+